MGRGASRERIRMLANHVGSVWACVESLPRDRPLLPTCTKLGESSEMTHGKGLVCSNCVTKCWLTILSDSPIYIPLCAFFVCGSPERIHTSFISHPLSPVLSTCSCGSRRSMCFFFPRGSRVCLEEKMWSQGSEPAGFPCPITLLWLKEQGNLPSRASGPSPLMGRPLATVGGDFTSAYLHSGMALAKGMSTFVVYKGLLFTRINSVNNYWALITCQALC